MRAIGQLWPSYTLTGEGHIVSTHFFGDGILMEIFWSYTNAGKECRVIMPWFQLFYFCWCPFWKMQLTFGCGYEKGCDLACFIDNHFRTCFFFRFWGEVRLQCFSEWRSRKTWKMCRLWCRVCRISSRWCSKMMSCRTQRPAMSCLVLATMVKGG